MKKEILIKTCPLCLNKFETKLKRKKYCNISCRTEYIRLSNIKEIVKLTENELKIQKRIKNEN